MTSPSEATARAFHVHAPGWWPGIRPFPEVALGEPVFGLTVLEPFASSIIHGPKRVENRKDAPPDRLCKGHAFWILVHTGSRLYPGVTREDFTLPRSTVDPSPCEGDLGLGDDEDAPPLWPDCPPFAAFEPRAIIGAARVVGAVYDGTIRGVDLDEWAIQDQCHWILDPTTIALPEPFPWPVGELGLWAPKVTDEKPARAELGRRFIEARNAVRHAMADPKNHRRAA